MIVLLIAAALAAQQTEPTARIAGRVLIRGENIAVANAHVELIQLDLPPAPGVNRAPATTTDADGRFTFTGVAQGRYEVLALKTGFASATQPGPPAPPIVRVTGGQTLDDVRVFLDRGAVIAGRVFDANGEPLPNVVAAGPPLQSTSPADPLRSSTSTTTFYPAVADRAAAQALILTSGVFRVGRRRRR